jgi:hypothetical protein
VRSKLKIVCLQNIKLFNSPTDKKSLKLSLSLNDFHHILPLLLNIYAELSWHVCDTENGTGVRKLPMERGLRVDTHNLRDNYLCALHLSFTLSPSTKVNNVKALVCLVAFSYNIFLCLYKYT